MYDIAIIGAGPAGSTVARMLGTRYRVLLVDRRELGGPRPEGGLGKSCGGLLAPAAQAELARQGLGLPAEVIAGQQLFAVRTLDLVADLERLYQRFYVNVDREAFDRWLVSLIPDRVETAFGWTLTDLTADDDGPFLRFSTSQGGMVGVRARMVIGADGASSLVRRLAYPQIAAARRYSAIQAEFSLRDADPYYGAIFDSRLTDYYGWTIPKGDRLLLGAAFEPGPGLAEKFSMLVERARECGFGFGEEVARTSAMVARPASLLQLCPGSGDILLAGEAAGFISPSSAEGISYAMTSAASLADALEVGLRGADARYRAASWPLALKVQGKALKSSAIYGAMSRRAIMRSGVGSIPTATRPTLSPQMVPQR
jgi:geranylgeranyl diphosphate/geranylgeranyl-bacteriochlorophyllide a reductase